MKYLVTLFSALLLLGCATKLPVPNNEVGYFAVPVFSVDESSNVGFSYKYVLRYENTETKKRGSITVIPQRGLKLIFKKNLEPGQYCFDSYFSEPVEKQEGRSYNFASNFIPLNDCFDIVEDQISIWRTKISVRRYDKEGGGWSQSHSFGSVNLSDVLAIKAELESRENFDKWTLEFTGSN